MDERTKTLIQGLMLLLIFRFAISALCAKDYGKDIVDNVSCKDGYCCEKKQSGCCQYDQTGLSSGQWTAIGVGILILLGALLLCCYLGARSTFCRWFFWSSSFSESHMKPLLTKSDESTSTSQSSSHPLKAAQPVYGKHDSDSDCLSLAMAEEVSSSEQSGKSVSSFPRCPLSSGNSCPCPSFSIFDWFSTGDRRSLPWDDEEAMMIPGSKGRRRMGRPIHWAGKSASKFAGGLAAEQRTLENVPVHTLWREKKWHRAGRRFFLESYHTEGNISQDDSVIPSKSKQEFSSGKLLSGSEGNLLACKSISTLVHMPESNIMNISSMQVKTQMKWNFVELNANERTRRKTIFRNARRARSLAAAGDKITRRRLTKRKRVERRSRSTPAKGKKRAVNCFCLKGKEAWNGCVHEALNLDSDPTNKLTCVHQNSYGVRLPEIESAFSDIFIPSSSDYEDQARGRQRSWRRKILPLTRRTPLSGQEQAGSENVLRFLSGKEEENKGRVEQNSRLHSRSNWNREQSFMPLNEDFQPADTLGSKRFNIGAWFAERQLESKSGGNESASKELIVMKGNCSSQQAPW